jgi:SH3-like domain-containing protein
MMGQTSNTHYMARVTRDYTAEFPDPIVMSKGQKLKLGERGVEYDRWIWCSGEDGKSGWVPEAYIEMVGENAIANCDYSAVELTAKVGEQVEVRKEESGWAWVIDSRGNAGWLPLENIEKLA